MRGSIDPIPLFQDWYQRATSTEPEVPEAASLATVGADLRPSNRLVLVKRVSESGFEFYTDYRSRKARDLQVNVAAALTFHWKSLRQSVRVEGDVERLSADASDRYWSTRPRQSRISATMSEQSAEISSRGELQARWRVEAARLAGGEIERPPHWGGYRLVPLRIEFWRHGEARLHDRLEFRREAVARPWELRVLQP